MNNDKHFITQAIAIAKESVQTGNGGPFGAVITKGGEIVATGTNRVTACNDPTAHAEVVAIREACQKLNHFELKECTLYASCEPCPMCLSAIYWARLKRVVFAAGKEQAERAGFDDAFIYKEIELPPPKRQIETVQMPLEEDDTPFALWRSSETKVEY
jgi:tRNA(Arg) A34 adenosine deaminase TadA